MDFVDLPELPDSNSTPSNIDTFGKPAGFKFSFIGIGQAGGRIAQTFADIGYGRVCAVNTAAADLAELSIPLTAKLKLGDSNGAGKDPQSAAAQFRGKEGEIFDLLKRCWSSDTDYGFVCLSAAGGTGAGGFETVVKAAKEYMRANKKPQRVGCVMALPKDADGPKGADNTLRTVYQLQRLNLSPIIFIDNAKFAALYGAAVSVRDEKPLANKTTAQILHAMNLVSGQTSTDTGGTVFDPADFAKVLDSGVIAMATVSLKTWATPQDISGPIREKLNASALSSNDLSQGTVASVVYVLSGGAWDGPDAVRAANLDHGVETMVRLLTKPNSTVFHGVYPQESPNSQVKILAVVGGLPLPLDRLKSLGVVSQDTSADIRQHLGI